MLTLFVDISSTRIILFTLKNRKINNLEKIVLPVGTIVNDKVILNDVVKSYINTYKRRKFINKVNLIIKPRAIIRFVSYPILKRSHLHSAVQYSLSDHFPVNINEYTIDYEILSTTDTINVMIAAVKTEIIQSYMQIVKNINSLDLAQNFITKQIGKLNNNNIITCVPYNNDVIIQHLQFGIVTSFVETDCTNLDRLFSRYININGDIDIKKAFVQLGTNEILIDYILSKNIEIIFFEEVYESFDIRLRGA